MVASFPKCFERRLYDVKFGRKKNTKFPATTLTVVEQMQQSKKGAEKLKLWKEYLLQPNTKEGGKNKKVKQSMQLFQQVATIDFFVLFSAEPRLYLSWFNYNRYNFYLVDLIDTILSWYNAENL